MKMLIHYWIGEMKLILTMKKDCVVMMIVERIIGLVAIIFMLEGRIIFL